MTIKSPPEWSWDHIKLAVFGIGSTSPEQYWPNASRHGTVPEVRRIGLEDLRIALRRGIDDFGANRTDVVFICVMYPVIGLVLARLAAGYQLLPLIFPLAAGFALVGPFAAIGLYEMSRRREAGAEVGWVDALAVFRSPAIGSIAYLGVMLVMIYVLWLLLAQAIYDLTLGPAQPDSVSAFLYDVFNTPAGWTMIAVGVGIGFVLAAVVLAISVVSFPFLLDHNADVGAAVTTSFRAVLVNPGPMAAWGLIIAVALLLGTIPFFLGLVVVIPVLGHATWHLYRRVVPS